MTNLSINVAMMCSQSCVEIYKKKCAFDVMLFKADRKQSSHKLHEDGSTVR